MFGFPRRGKPNIRVDYVTPDGTPAPTAAEVEARIDTIDLQLSAIAAIPPHKRTRWLWCRLDELIDERLALRPPRPPAQVPVIPERSS